MRSTVSIRMVFEAVYFLLMNRLIISIKLFQVLVHRFTILLFRISKETTFHFVERFLGPSVASSLVLIIDLHWS